jgi:hypothetical protein
MIITTKKSNIKNLKLISMWMMMTMQKNQSSKSKAFFKLEETMKVMSRTKRKTSNKRRMKKRFSRTMKRNSKRNRISKLKRMQKKLLA